MSLTTALNASGQTGPLLSETPDAQIENADDTTEADSDEPGLGVYTELGRLPPSTPLTESGLARLLGKRCRESIKRAVARGELPPPVKLMGQNCWTAVRIVQHFENRLEAESRKISRLRPGA